jgi:ribosome biogenesis GTPase
MERFITRLRYLKSRGGFLLKGIILRGYSSFYYVLVEDKEYECSLRGKYRVKKQDFLPGDYVLISVVEDNKGVIEEVLPRENQLVRPPIANVNQAVLVMAVKNPLPDLQLLDRLLVIANYQSIIPVICFNKIDLDGNKGAELASIYRKAGYTVILTSTKKNIGLVELKNHLKNHVTVFAGPSGVGKSSLLNLIMPGLALKTGDVGVKSQRGKHTTRYTNLIPLPSGGLVADTPGFSRLYLPDMKREELSKCFPEFNDYAQLCRFNTCLHHKEPDCAVKKALEEGLLDSHRYEHYLTFLSEVIARERSY